MENKWSNYGDKNFLDYGGCLLRDTASKHIFDVIDFDPEQVDVKDEDGSVVEAIHVFVAFLTVDIDEDWIDWQFVYRLHGLEDHDSEMRLTDFTPQELAVLAVNSYSEFDFSPVFPSTSIQGAPYPGDCLLTEAMEFMSAYGAIQFERKIDGNTSDGYHTFNELYHHRAVLFALICSDHADIAWKSKLHEDGTMFDGMFIVGITTPQGNATYHYENEEWPLFEGVKELPNAPHFDGHTPDEALRRIASIIHSTVEDK